MARVLIIDDEKPVRDILRRVCETDGHEVEEAADGQQGLDAYRSHPSDLVVVDMWMPVKNGLEVIRELRRDCPKARIIAMAGIGRWILDEAENAGANRSFLKPFDIDEVRMMVESLLHEKTEDS